MSKKIFAILVLALIQGLYAYPHTVRVGFYHMNGYHEIDSAGTKSGYGYDFLQMVSRHSNLNFEYVGYDLTLDESLDKLHKGEIDVVTSVRKTEEREKIFDYSLPIGRTCGKLNVRSGTEKFVVNKYSTYNGMVVGLVNGNARNQDFERFAREKNFSYVAKNFESLELLENALRQGDVDAVMTSSLRRSNDELTLDEFAQDNFYAVVKKGNKALLEEIDYAVSQMNNTYGVWKDHLYDLYYENRTSDNIVFSGREQDFISGHSAKECPLKVLLREDRAPYAYVENGSVRGILPDIFAEIMNLNGMDFEYVVAKDHEQYERIISEKNMDLVLDKIGHDEDSLKWIMSPPYFKMTVSSIYKKGFNGIAKRIALLKSFTNLSRQKVYRGIELVYCDSPEEAAELVLKGDVDAAYMFRYVAEKVLNSDNSSQIAIGDVSGLTSDVYLGVLEEDDHVLVSILSKCVSVLSQTKVDGIVASYVSFSASNITFLEYLKAYPMMVVLGSLTLVLLVLMIIIAVIYARSKSIMLVKERKEQIKLREAQAVADAANLAKSKFLFNMSHDIRTPMNAILGYARKIEKNPENAEDVKSSIQKINIASGYMLDLINDVLDMSGVEADRLKLDEEVTDLNLCMEELCGILNPSINMKKLSFVRDFSGIKSNFVMLDSQRVRQVLSNVISNSVKFTPTGGMIVFTVREFESRRSGYASFNFTIKDSGIGMSSEFKEHIFEEFSRERTATESKIAGIGLGMAIVRRLVDLMGGDVEIESEKGKGTTVSICFDFKIASSESVKSLQSSMKVDEIDWALKGRKILLVEDNDFNREIALDLLQEAGLSVDTAENGSVAVDMVVDKGPDYYDCILMDLQMPVMNGFEATRAIRELYPTPHIPIIAISANAFEEDRQESMSAGMDEHLPKPIDPAALFEVMKSFMR